MKFTVLDKKKAKEYKPKGLAVLIGITDLGGEFPAYQGDYIDILTLQFDDIEHEMNIRYGVYKLFDEEQAGEILGFASLYEKDEIVVHCEMGVSRSAAVAAALCHLMGQDSKEFFIPPYDPNQHVYNTMLEVASDLDIAW